MRLDANNPISLGALDNALRNAQEPSLDLLSKIINSACTRVQALPQALTHVVRLAEIGAWTDATFALIAFELPLWTVRRLAYENGEWLCSLSRQPNLPMTFDDCAEAGHEILPLAMQRSSKRAAGVTWPGISYPPFLKSRHHQPITSFPVRITGEAGILRLQAPIAKRPTRVLACLAVSISRRHNAYVAFMRMGRRSSRIHTRLGAASVRLEQKDGTVKPTRVHVQPVFRLEANNGWAKSDATGFRRTGH